MRSKQSVFISCITLFSWPGCQFQERHLPRPSLFPRMSGFNPSFVDFGNHPCSCSLATPCTVNQALYITIGEDHSIQAGKVIQTGFPWRLVNRVSFVTKTRIQFPLHWPRARGPTGPVSLHLIRSLFRQGMISAIPCLFRRPVIPGLLAISCEIYHKYSMTSPNLWVS